MVHARRYALAIIHLLEEGVDPKEVARNIVEHTKRRGHWGVVPHLILSLKREFADRERRKTAVVRVVREDDVPAALSALSKYAGRGSDDKRPVRVHLDDSLIGGWTIRTKNTYVDASYKRALLSIFNNVARKR